MVQPLPRASGNEGFAFLVPAAPGFFATFTARSLFSTKPVALQLPVKCSRAPAARTAFPWHFRTATLTAVTTGDKAYSLFSQQQSSLCCPPLAPAFRMFKCRIKPQSPSNIVIRAILLSRKVNYQVLKGKKELPRGVEHG